VSEDDRRRAVDAFKQAVELNPRNEQAFLQLGYAYAGLGQMDEAKQAWREFLKIAPNDPQAADVKDMLK
jgi:Flp pilus assembly protein TadD